MTNEYFVYAKHATKGQGAAITIKAKSGAECLDIAKRRLIEDWGDMLFTIQRINKL